MSRKSIILKTDGYKPSHPDQYPPDTEALFGYIEARKKGSFTMSMGMPGIIAEHLMTPITKGDIDFAEDFSYAYGSPFHRAMWEAVVAEHHGYLPVRIRAVPEGTIVPNGIAIATVESLGGKKFATLGSYIEPLLLRMWYPSTVAAKSYRIKQVIAQELVATGSDLSSLPWRLHDFGARGATCDEAASIGGMAHLANFSGSDTMTAVASIMLNYPKPEDHSDIYMPGGTIPAAEHSTITAWGREFEVDAYRNMIQQFAQPGRSFAVVSDAYNIYDAVEHLWGEKLRQEVIDSGATLVVRPDSGEPADMVLWCVKTLAEKYGVTRNSKDYKVLRHVRVIQGDGLDDEEDIRNILLTLAAHGFAAENVFFGMGGGLLQKVNRDTEEFAMKTSAINRGGVWHDVFKDPYTAPGKRSKRGRLMTVVDHEGYFLTIREEDFPKFERDNYVDAMVTQYLPGEFLNQSDWEQVRQRTGMWG